MTDPITTYVDEVARHLRARGTTRRQALTDLEAALRETAATYASNAAEAGTDAAEAADEPLAAAVAAFGSARAYATELDAELGTDRPLKTVFGIPNSLAAGVLERMAATFDPSDEHLVVPHVFGIGWALNMGAVAVRLGLLNPDDLDDDLLGRAVDGPGRWSRRLAWASVGAVGLAAATAVRKRRRVGFTGPRSRTDLVGSGAVAAATTALAILAGDPRLPAGQRLVSPAYATLFATVTAAALAGVRDDGTRPRWAGWWGLPLGTALWWIETYGPVKLTVDRSVRR